MTSQEQAHWTADKQGLAELDADLAEPWLAVPEMKRTGIQDALAVQQVRLLRRLLEKLGDGRDRSEGCSNG